MDCELTDAELEELLNGVQTQQEPTEELVPTQIELPMQKEVNKAEYYDIFRKFLHFALHPKGAYGNVKYDEELQPNYEGKQSTNSTRISYLYMLLRIAYEKLCQIYNLSFTLYLQPRSQMLMISDRSMALLLQLTFLETVNGLLNDIAKRLPTLLQEEFDGFISRIEDNDINFIHNKSYSDQTIVKIKEKAEQLEQTMRETVMEIPDKFLEALMFRYCFGVLVLPADFMANVDSNKENPNYPFQTSKYKNKVLFAWNGGTMLPGSVGEQIWFLPDILKVISNNLRTVARSAALSVIQAKFSEFTWNLKEENDIWKPLATQTLVYAWSTVPQKADEELLRRTNNHSYIEQFINAARGKPITKEYQRWDPAINDRRKDEIVAPTTDLYRIINKMIQTLKPKETKKPTKKIIEMDLHGTENN